MVALRLIRLALAWRFTGAKRRMAIDKKTAARFASPAVLF
jgi:hypothetical protein